MTLDVKEVTPALLATQQHTLASHVEGKFVKTLELLLPGSVEGMPPPVTFTKVTTYRVTTLQGLKSGSSVGSLRTHTEDLDMAIKIYNAVTPMEDP